MKQKKHPQYFSAEPYPLLYCSRVGLDGYINKKKSSKILELFVGAEGFEPPTLCL